jgi:hypothetical protein
MDTVVNFDLCTIGNFNSVTGQLIISTDDFVTYPPNTYSFTIKGSIVGANSINKETHFQIKFMNPCLSSKLSLATVPFKNVDQFYFDPDIIILYDVQVLASHDMPFNCGVFSVEFNL